jgi:hypothetical protein
LLLGWVNEYISTGNITTNPIINITDITSLRHRLMPLGQLNDAKTSPIVPSHASVLSNMPNTSPNIVKNRLSRANPTAGRTPTTKYITDQRIRTTMYIYSIKVTRQVKYSDLIARPGLDAVVGRPAIKRGMSRHVRGIFSSNYLVPLTYQRIPKEYPEPSHKSDSLFARARCPQYLSQIEERQ